MSLAVESARDIILDALEDINVHMDETTLGASDEQTGTKAINRIMATLSANGVDLGFTKLTNVSDLITIPEGAMDALVSILGLRLWPKYRTPSPTNTIIANARVGETQMYKLGISIGVTEFPSTLPRGSGNTSQGYDYNPFYTGGIVDSILAENSGSISLEDDTE